MLEDELGDVLAKARRGLGLHPAALARLIGEPESRIEAWEAYRDMPDPAILGPLARHLGLREQALRDLADGTWQPGIPQEDPDWEVRGLTLANESGFTSNTWLVRHRSGQESAIVDPGFEPGTIDATLRRLGWTPAVILITHGHHDHVGSAELLARRHGIPIRIGHEDLELLPRSADLSAFEAVAGGEVIPAGRGSIAVLAAPGHTTGGRCYLAGTCCFVGDTLFAGSIGRTFGGPPDYPRHLATVRATVLGLPPATGIHPGHGPSTTVARERAANPFA